MRELSLASRREGATYAIPGTHNVVEGMTISGGARLVVLVGRPKAIAVYVS